MSGCLSRSSYKLSNKKSFVNEEYHSIDLLEKKNITDNNNNNIIILNNNKINSLRRTSSSADMSSEKWAQNNGVSMIKRVHSSENLQSLGEKNDYINEDIVNYDVDNKGSCGGAAFEDIWSSILSGKKPVEAGSGDPAPYVHPLVKRASSLSEKSLEICTESLGSETGSDGFSIPLTDPGDGQEGEEVCGDEVEVVRKNDDVVVEVVGEKYNYNNNLANSKKVNVGVERSFPPPLPSLVNSDGGSNLHMRTRRHGGRVVVEAVAVSTPQCFRAQREDGRLLLTFSGDNDSAENEQESKFKPKELESELASKLNLEPDPEQFSDELVQKVDESSAMSWAPKVISVTIQAPKAMSMNKLIELTCTKSHSMWPRASNKTFVKSLENEHAKLVEVEEFARQKVVTHSLPPRPGVNTTITTPTKLNEYEYYWRNSPISASAVTVFKPFAGKQNNYFVDSVSPQVVKESNKRMNKFLLGNNEKGGEQEKVVLVGEEEYLVPFFRGCKDSRRSLLFWEPYCIATS